MPFKWVRFIGVANMLVLICPRLCQELSQSSLTKSKYRVFTKLKQIHLLPPTHSVDCVTILLFAVWMIWLNIRPERSSWVQIRLEGNKTEPLRHVITLLFSKILSTASFSINSFIENIFSENIVKQCIFKNFSCQYACLLFRDHCKFIQDNDTANVNGEAASTFNSCHFHLP